MYTTKIAIQKNGKLSQASLNYLNSLGFKFSLNNKIANSCDNCNLDVVLLRDDDIPQYVNQGWVDYGIVGKDVLLETNKDTQILQKLSFGRCSLILASPKNSPIKSILDLQNKRIATSYPNLTNKFLKDAGIKATLVVLSGSVEIAPALGLADAIIDITETGRTLAENNLKILDVILNSEALLIANPNLPTKDNLFNSICKSLIPNNLVFNK